MALKPHPVKQLVSFYNKQFIKGLSSTLLHPRTQLFTGVTLCKDEIVVMQQNFLMGTPSLPQKWDPVRQEQETVQQSLAAMQINVGNVTQFSGTSIFLNPSAPGVVVIKNAREKNQWQPDQARKDSLQIIALMQENMLAEDKDTYFCPDMETKYVLQLDRDLFQPW